MRELEVLDQGHLKLSWEERKEFFEEELGERVRSEVKRLLEAALEAERTDWLGVGRYVRDEAGRQDYRNGYYRRDLGTRLGLLRPLRVPRTRRGCRSQLLGRYQRRRLPDDYVYLFLLRMINYSYTIQRAPLVSRMRSPTKDAGASGGELAGRGD